MEISGQCLTFAAMVRVMWLLVFSLSANAAFAQAPYRLELGPVGGFLMPHHDHMLYLADGHVRGISTSIHFETDGSKDWHHAFNFPTWGFSIAGYNLGSARLGEGYSLHSFVNLPLDGKRRYSIMMGIGMGYVTRPFNLEDNFQNGAIGSRLNASLELSAYRKWRLSEHLALRAGIGIRHMSNGAMRLPNTGINLAVATLALQYAPEEHNPPQRLRKEVEDKAWHLYGGMSFGVKEVLPLGGPSYGVVNGFASAQKRINPKSSWGAEGGVNYNASLEPRAIDRGASPSAGLNFRAYLAGQYILHFGLLSLRLQAGSYILPKFEDDGLVFFRYQLLYEQGRWQAFVGLKTHYAKADNGELGIAFRIL